MTGVGRQIFFGSIVMQQYLIAFARIDELEFF